MPYFEKQEAGKTKWWEITREAEGHRYYVAWGVLGARGQGMTCTRDSPEECDRMIASKMREKVKAGYVEAPTPQARAPKAKTKAKMPPTPAEPGVAAQTQDAASPALNAVVDVFMAEVQDYFTPYKMEGLKHCYHVEGGLDWFDGYLVAGPTPSIGLIFRVKHGTAEPGQVQRFLEHLEARYDEVFSVEVAWKFRLDEPIGSFGHALVLSPLAANIYNKGLTKRQLFKALPIFDCEFVGNENVSQAEARTTGRACIPTSTWNRKPHPVVDMTTQAPGKKKSKLLIYDPRVLGNFVKGTDAKPGAILEVHNYRGAVARVTRGKTLELALPAEAEAHTHTLEAVIERLEAFVREG